MAGVYFKQGFRSTFVSDIRAIAEKLHSSPKIVVLEGEEIEKGLAKISSSLFLEENLVVFLVNPKKETIEKLKPLLDTLSHKISVVIHEIKDKEASAFRFSPPEERLLKKKVLSILKDHGKTMTDKAYAIFMQKIRDEALIECELLKLINYVGDRKEIRSADVDTIVSGSEEESLISLFEAIKEGDKRESIRILHTLFISGMSPLLVHAYLIRLVRLLIQAKEISNVLDLSNSETLFYKKFSGLRNLFPFLPEDKKNYFPLLSPKYALGLMKLANRISLKRLKDLYASLISYDLRLKTGTKFDTIRLENLLLWSFYG